MKYLSVYDCVQYVDNVQFVIGQWSTGGGWYIVTTVLPSIFEHSRSSMTKQVLRVLLTSYWGSSNNEGSSFLYALCLLVACFFPLSWSRYGRRADQCHSAMSLTVNRLVEPVYVTLILEFLSWHRDSKTRLFVDIVSTRDRGLFSEKGKLVLASNIERSSGRCLYRFIFMIYFFPYDLQWKSRYIIRYRCGHFYRVKGTRVQVISKIRKYQNNISSS